MLSFAFRNLKNVCDKNMDVEKFDNTYDLFSVILYRGITSLIKKNLFKDYVSISETLNKPAGKINLSSSIKVGAFSQKKIICEKDKLTENYTLNQIIKSTCHLLITSEQIKEANKNLLKDVMKPFSHISLIDLKKVKWNSLDFHKHNEHYRMLIKFCRIISAGMLLTTNTGKHKLQQHLDEGELWRLFQNFVREYYKKYYPELNPAAYKIRWDTLPTDDTTLLPEMQSDVILSDGAKTLIIDTKFYSKKILNKYHNKESLRSSVLYQIYTYVKNKQEKTEQLVEGLVLFAKTDIEDEVYFSNTITGNKLQAKTIDLNKEWIHIKKALDGIIEETFKITKETGKSLWT